MPIQRLVPLQQVLPGGDVPASAVAGADGAGGEFGGDAA